MSVIESYYNINVTIELDTNFILLSSALVPLIGIAFNVCMFMGKRFDQWTSNVVYI